MPERVDEAATTEWLTPGVKGIGGASLLADVGHEIPTSLLPSLLTSTLGAPASALGLIEGVSDALAGAARFGGGALSDEPDRRRNLAVGGYTATAVLSAAIAPATAVWQVAVLRAGAWTARGIRVPARNALLADVVPAKFYGRAYGFERSMDNLGAILGPAFGLAYLGFTRDTTSWTALLPWFVLAGIGIGCVETAEHTAVATHAPEHLRGSAFGLLAATQSFGNLAASAVAGILWTALSPT